jgi:hypothetical protein
MRVYDDDDAELDATFSVTRTAIGCVLTVESRGPGGTGPKARNAQYNEGLQLLITRLAKLGATLDDARLASRNARDLSEDQRRLKLQHEYPILLSDVNAEELRGELGAAQAATGRQPGAAGPGNPTKRIELVLRLPVYTGTGSELETELAFGSEFEPFAAAGIDPAEQEPGTSPDRTIRRARRRREQRFLRAVELHAMAVATSWYTAQGYEVVDVGAVRPWDLEATRGNERRRVEVKGSAGLRDAVDLTVGEVRNAGEWMPTDLFVVDSIEVTEVNGVIHTNAGRCRRWAEWSPSPESLQALTFSHVLASAPQRLTVSNSVEHTDLVDEG